MTLRLIFLVALCNLEIGVNNFKTLAHTSVVGNVVNHEFRIKPESMFPIQLPSLRLPCKRYSCRFGNCENLIVNNVLNYTCHCVRGVAGPNCDTLDHEKLPCSSNPCYGGAKCYNYMDDYYCECPQGRDGKNCNTSTANASDPCKANPCGSQGICFTATNGYWCFCNDGKHGFNCNNLEEKLIFTKLCNRDTCLNGGRCIPMNNSIICACKSNYYGPKCEYKLNNNNNVIIKEKCLTNVCQNNGTCSIKNGKVFCICNSDYTGKYCESNVYVPCGDGMCNNINGICVMDICYCLKGFYGSKCEKKYDLK